ncbi:MAG TPA: amylo-alpha-1,6-glucosidase, partial [Candidatus Nanoarchaeia archaeon]|nr:amylo-alpha-1,6-glucosidase [Candidatus Nanoarchaeia archaeon]
GENPKSYHNGDSWFWLNNLAALVMYGVDKKKFKQDIDAIIKSSTEDILWNGAIGHHSELSSASTQKAEGCLAMAWSSAMFVELIEETKKDNL